MSEIVAKVKFWFGKGEKIFDTKKFDVEYSKADDNFAYIMRKSKKKKREVV